VKPLGQDRLNLFAFITLGLPQTQPTVKLNQLSSKPSPKASLI
jgi:hypothetical protein